MIDTHCHLNHPDFHSDLPEVLLRAEKAGVERIVCGAYDLDSSGAAVKLSREIGVVYATVGIHPHDSSSMYPGAEEQLKDQISRNKKVVAVGETGLDYYYDHSPRDVQREAYRRHIRLANDAGLPLVVHSRDAQEDVIAILTQEGVPSAGTVMHCMPADAEFARAALELGCYLGMAGPVTFKNAEVLRNIVSGLPLDRLLLETDAPYLTPHPHRGERNEPARLPLIARRVAEVKKVSTEEVDAQTTANARRLFFREG